MENLVVILDGGHGWDTLGKEVKNIKENEFNDAIVNKLGILLSCNNVPYHILSSNWRDTPLTERVRHEHTIVNSYEKGQEFLGISIHANAASSSSANGFEVFHSVSSLKGPLFANILNKLINELLKENLTHNIKTNRGVKTANFYILNKTKSPFVLIEAGFMTNLNDEKALLDETFRNRFTHIVHSAILIYLEKLKFAKGDAKKR